MAMLDPNDLPDPNPLVDIDGEPIEIGRQIHWDDDTYKVTGYSTDTVGPLLDLVGLDGMYQSKYRPMRPEKYRQMQRDERRAAVTKKTKRSKRKGGTGKCAHCGAPTGGRFAVGHDSKLKSELLAAWREDGEGYAAIEAVARGWWDEAKVIAEAPNARVLAEVLAVLEAQGDDDEAMADLIKRRNEARYDRSDINRWTQEEAS